MRRTILLIAILCAACHDTTAPAGNLAGTWAEDSDFPGSSLQFDITQSDGSLSGTGRYSIEAGRSGDLEVTGTYAPPHITLSITYDYGPSETFTGTLLDSNHMAGTVDNGSGSTFAMTFTRQ